MRKVVKKFNRALSVLLVAAMVVGMTPDVCLTVNAEETAQTEETATVEETVDNSVDEVAADDGEATPEEEPVQEEQAPAEEPAPVEEQAPANDTENAENTESSTPAAETTASESADNTTGEEEVTPAEPVAEELAQPAPVVVEEPVVDVQEVVEEPVDNGVDGESHTVSGNTNASEYGLTLTDADGDTDGNQAKEGTDYTFTVAKKEGFNITDVIAKVVGNETDLITNTEYPTANGDTKEYTIEGASITGDVTIEVVTEAEQSQDPDPAPSTSYAVTIADGSNPNVKMSVAKSVTYDDNGDVVIPSADAFEVIDADGIEVPQNESFLVKVDKIAGVKVSVDLGSGIEKADAYYYEANASKDYALRATATVPVNITTDDDARYNNIVLGQSAGTDVEVVNPVMLTGDDIVGADYYNQAPLTYGATYDIEITTASANDIIKSITVDGEKKYPTVDGNVYKFEKAVVAKGDVELIVTAGDKNEVTLVEADGLTIAYSENSSVTKDAPGTNTWSSGAINWNGKLYFTATAADGKRLDKVEVCVADIDGDLLDSNYTEITASNGVYSVDITKNTKIKFTVTDVYAVTVNGVGGENDNVASYAWSLTKDGTFTTVDSTKADTAMPKIANGEKIYLQFALKSDVTGKVSVPEGQATLVEKTSTSAKDTWEVTMSGTGVTVEPTVDSDTNKLSVTFAYTEAASIEKIEYKESTESTWKTVATNATTEAPEATAYKAIEVNPGAYLNVKVTLKSTVTNKYVDTINNKDAVNGQVSFRVTEALDSVAISLGEFKTVTLKQGDAYDATVEYKVGADGTYQSITVPENTDDTTDEDGVKIENVKDITEVYLKITPASGKKIATVDGATLVDNGADKGAYKVTTNPVTITTATDTSKKVTFKVDNRKVIETISYQVANANPADTFSGTLLTVPTKLKLEPTVVAEGLELSTDKNVYFTISPVDNNEVTIKSVKVNGEVVTADVNNIYEIKNATFAEAAEATVEIETISQNTITYAISGTATVKTKPAAEGENAVTMTNGDTKTLKAGESFSFTVEYNKDTTKIDKVLTRVTVDGKDVDTAITGSETAATESQPNTIMTYTITPEEDCKLVVETHDMEAVNVTFDFANATVEAATKADMSDKASVTSNTAYSSAKEDQTVYFTVTPADYYKVVSVQHVTTDEKGNEVRTDISASSDVYSFSLADIKTPQSIEIKTARDEAKNNAVVFDADMNAITVVEIPEGNTLYTDATSATVTLKVNPGYKVTEINVSGVEKPLEFSEETLKTGYPIAISGLADLTKADATPSKVTVTVKTEKIALETDKTIYVNNYGAYSYDVVGEGVECTDWDEYTIAKGTTDFNITVVVNKDYVPSVSYDNDGDENTADFTIKATGTPVKVSDTKVEYTINVLASTIVGDTITITTSGTPAETETVKATIKVAKTIDGVNPTVEFNNSSKKANSADFTTYVAEYTKGGTAVIRVSVPENHFITVDGLEFVYEETVAGKDIYKAYIAEMTADVEATITASEDNILTVLKNGEEVKSNNKGVYSASKGDVFTVSIQTGSKTGTFTDATVAAKGVTFAEEDIKNANGTVTFTVPEVAAGKTVTLTVSYGDTSKSYKIAVAKAVKKVTVKGAKQGVITQTLDTTAAYQITGTKDLSVLYTEVAKATENGVEGVVANFDLEKGVLNITTPKAEGSAVVTIKSKAEQVAVLDKDGNETDKTEDATLATITVTSVAPTLKMGKVDTPVILDNSVTLNMIADKNTKKVNGTDLQYKIEVTPSETYKDFTKPEKAVTATTYADVQFDDKGAVKATSKVVNLINVDQGKGQVWEFTVKVSLVQKDGTKDIAISEKAIEKKVVTKAPYYEDKLTLKKGTTTVYTGQQNVVVATPKFSKNATYQGTGTALVYNSKGEIADDVYAQWTPEGTIVVSVYNEYASIGSYTLKVIPDADKDTTFMYAAPATMKINVVRGIYAISATSGNIYKAANKAVTYNMNVKFNDGSSYYKPKTAKATYEVGKMVYGEFVADKELAKYISVKNGKISIKKNYKLAADPEDNKFAVKVTAADYKENTLSETFVYKVTGEKAQMGTLYLAKYVNDKYYLPEDNTFTTDEFPQYGPIMLKAGVEAGRSYYTEDDVTFDFDISFSNKKVYLFSYNNHTIAKNVTMTATAADGSKAKSTYKFNLEYNKATLGIAGFNTDDEEDYVAVVKTAEGKYEFNANTADDTITFNVGTKNANGGYDNFDSRATYNYKVSVKGGKIVSSSVYEGKYTVVPTAQKMTITLQDKSTGKAVNTKYELTNNAFVKVKAPNVTVEKKNIYSNSSETIKLTVAKTAYTHAYITYDAVEFAKNSTYPKYYNYYSISGVGTPVSLNADKATDIMLGVNYAPAHTYKLNVTFGTVNSEDEFVPATKAKTVKIAVKAVTTFKPTAKYTMDAKVGSVTLTGKPAELANVAYANAVIENANVKGQPNNFTKIFAYVDGKLVLQQNAATKKPYTAEELAAIPKTDLTGYVTYWNEKTDTYESAKITVNFKAVKYTATAISVMADKAGIATGTTTIMNGKTPVSVGKVYAVCDKAEFTAEMKEGKLTVASKAAIEAGKYAIKLYVVESDAYYTSLVTNAETAAQYGTEVKLQFTVLNPVKGKVKFVAKDLKVKFDANDYIAADKAWSRTIGYSVAVAGADVKVITLTDAPEYYTLAKVADANAITVSLDKDKLVAAEAAKETNKSLYKATSKAKLSVEFNNGETETIAINLTAAAKPQTFAEAVDIIKAAETKELKEVTLLSSNESKWAELLTAKANSLISKESGAVATVTGEKVTLSVDNKDYFIGKVAVVNNDKGADAKENYTSENIKWAITDVEADTTQEVADAAVAVETALEEAYGTTPSTKINNSITEADVLEVIKKAVTDKSINVRADINIKLATEDNTGILTVSGKLSRSIWSRTTFDYTVSWAELNDLAEAVDAVKTAFAANDYTLTNKSTEADVIAIANAAKNNPAITIAFGVDKSSEDPAGPNESFRIEEANKAAEGKPGSVSGTLIFSQEGKEPVKVVLGTDATVTIKAWDSATTAAGKIPTYVQNSNNFTATNATTASDIIAVAKKAYHDPENKITITVAKTTETVEGSTETKEVDDFKLTEATVKKSGSIAVKLNVAVGEATPTTATISLTIAQLPQTVEEAAVVASKAIEDLAKDTTKEATEANVKAAVEAVVGCTVAVQNYKKVAATTEAEGSITFDVKLSNSSEDKDYVIISKTITLPKVEAPTS